MELERPVVPCMFGLQRLKDKETLEAAAAAEFDCAKKPLSAAPPSSPGGGGGGGLGLGLGLGLGPLPRAASAARRCDAGAEGDAAAGEAEGDVPPALAADRTRPCTFVGDKYLVLDPVEGSTLYRCVDVNTREELVCKVSAAREASALLLAHARLDGERRVSALREALAYAGGRRCLVFARAYGDLHTHVRAHVRPRRGLREAEARRLFRQAAEAVAACHAQGVVLRDLKLRKFVFADPQRTELKLETLEDAVLLEDPDDDRLQDKRGCPAYVSPEILRCHASYSGRAADMWSLGVILYTMLVGRYPFNDSEHASLFAKISRGHFVLPDWLSARARCLVRSLLRRDPEQRLLAADVLLHPWLQAQGAGAGDERDAPVGGCRGGGGGAGGGGAGAAGDQVVPECP
ncbi:hypothetical protein R5R35_005591 [Gryllus longicercus]|uniref:Protein kinase domain-containing protein n=1 Tax=Gryllus longicercus TaxID=2509291 RepID=A0AAN9YY68_9ORTH